MHIMLDKSGDGWKNPAVLQAAQDERKLWDAKCIAEDARGFQYPAGQQTIAFGDSIGELVGSWLPSELASSAGKDFRWGAFNFPTVAGGSGKATDLEVALLSFMVLKNSPHPKEAIDFIKFALGEHSQKLMAEIGGVGVTRKGVKWPEALHDAEEAASQATALQGVGGGLDVAYPAFYATVAEPEHNKMFLGQIAPEVLVDILAAKTKEYWERNPG
ncbi:extracellular solute-binding protein [Rhizobium tubonense]|uniref:ABC transporter substrate-binding protein n=1 Tax=Rhizobium tubonense TaxID=484088 RepID=A0A2W4CJR8_9HYPH|nr:extracellular solute-binding protein [Rhizobium tubonense]PZM11268.1 hypothetical protein CPY51_21155 [Rhizobium tubonense]